MLEARVIRGKRELLFLAMLIMGVWLSYLPILNHPLIWDSKQLIENNRFLNEKTPIAAAFQHGYWGSTSKSVSGTDYYRPLLIASFMIERHLWGLDPFRMRLVNLLLFSICLIILFLLLTRQCKEKETVGSALILFAFYPLHVDHITWVAGRGDMLMLLFGLLATLFLVYFMKEKKMKWAILSCFCLLASLFSKESALLFLPFLLIYQWQQEKKIRWFYHSTNAVIAAFFWLVKLTVVGQGAFLLNPFPSLLSALKIAVGVVGYYFRCLLIPFRIQMFITLDESNDSILLVWGIGGFLLIGFCIYLWRHQLAIIQALTLFIFFFIIQVALAFSNLFPFSIFCRYLLIPLIGWCFLIAHSLGSLGRKSRYLIMGAILLFFVVSIQVQGFHYRSELDFWDYALQAKKPSSITLTKYGEALLSREEIIQAEITFNRALRLKMKPATAASILLAMSWIDFRRADYPSSLSWIDQLENSIIGDTHKNEAWEARYRVSLARGDLSGALKILDDRGANWPPILLFEKKIDICLAFARWDEARTLASEIEKRLQRPGMVNQIERAAERFTACTLDQKRDYFLRVQNYAKALEYSTESLTLLDRLSVSRLRYLSGDPVGGLAEIQHIYESHQDNSRILNTLGNFYWQNFFRLDEALTYFQKSLQVNPQQPSLKTIVKTLLVWQAQLAQFDKKTIP